MSLTVYRDRPASARSLREAGRGEASGLALVTEARTVDLPAGRTRIDFAGVADEIIPASARLSGLPGRLVERNFDYDLTSPGALIEEAVDGEVTIRRTNPKTGRTVEERATLRSGPDGVVLQTAEGVEALGCGAGPQALVFDHLPAGLAAKPTLSVVADAPRAGRYQLTLSYLMVGVDWSADYVARVAPDGETLDLTGWLTLSNRSGATFAEAPTEVVAGKLARVAPGLPRITATQVEDECWPMGTTTSDLRRAPPEREEQLQGLAVATNAPAPPLTMRFGAFAAAKSESRVRAETLGDYRLYALNEPTTVAASQTKQIRFLRQQSVRFETLYVDAPALGWLTDNIVDGFVPAETTLSFENNSASGLGLALPAGAVSMRQPQDVAGGRELFLGEASLRDVPVGEPFELSLGLAADVEAKARAVSVTQVGSGVRRRNRTKAEVTITNAKPSAATYELRVRSGERGMSVAAESAPHVIKHGQVVWRLTLPAESTTVLALTLDTD